MSSQRMKTMSQTITARSRVVFENRVNEENLVVDKVLSLPREDVKALIEDVISKAQNIEGTEDLFSSQILGDRDFGPAIRNARIERMWSYDDDGDWPNGPGPLVVEINTHLLNGVESVRERWENLMAILPYSVGDESGPTPELGEMLRTYIYTQIIQNLKTRADIEEEEVGIIIAEHVAKLEAETEEQKES